MKKVCGFALFWTAIGMFIMMLLPNLVWGVILTIVFLVLGYRLFCCWTRYRTAHAVRCTVQPGTTSVHRAYRIKNITPDLISQFRGYSVSLKKIFVWLRTLYTSGLQTGCTNIHFFRSAFCLNSDRLYIWFPHFRCSSMRVAYIVSKMSTLFTNSTFSHDCTS